MEEHPFTNRLIHEKSPYLLQHAHNPVNWYPWSDEAVEEARSREKPIFLSIGYATCHWCHVMERESFENSEIADLMNQAFVNIKVDREELHDIDTIYMEIAQSMMTGAAGWPLNVILTPDLKPFFSATYIPPTSKDGVTGMKELIENIQSLWNSPERATLIEQSSQLVELYRASTIPSDYEMPDHETINDAAELLFQLADPIYGGLKGSPKFPIGYHINFLLTYSARSKDSRAFYLVEKTLDMMHRGGIYDHLAGGFSRYSVDEQWHVPHFEKMLYDNAILTHSYCRAWQMTKNPFYSIVCKEIIEYVLRELTSKGGGFFSAEDSETHQCEGLYYTWSLEEIKQTIPEEDLSIFCQFFSISDKGNLDGRNVLHTPQNIDEFCQSRGLNVEEFFEKIEKYKKILLKIRDQRDHPFKDDKILSSWNGLMINAMAIAGTALGESKFLDAAVKAAIFIRENLWKDQTLLRRWREGEASFNGGLQEYAAMIRACITLFESDCGSEWLRWALEMTDKVEREFKSEEGAYYDTDGKDPKIIIRKFSFSDGAEPSANALHCENLLRLYQISADENYLYLAEDIIKNAKPYVESYPPGYIYHIINLQRYYDTKAPNLVVSLDDKETLKDELYQILYSTYTPYRTVVWRRKQDDTLFKLIPFIREQEPHEDKTTLFICRRGICLDPLTNFDAMKKALEEL
ncbi:MAG: thioredoxin domain-containing protein [Chlamydiales bacterium]